jgi:hypothetical protein
VIIVEIAQVTARMFNVPLAKILVDAKHGTHTHFQLICATVHLSDGRYATGYTYTGGRGGSAIAKLIEDDLTPFLCVKLRRHNRIVESGKAKRIGRGPSF